jgi:hypothetical protein
MSEEVRVEANKWKLKEFTAPRRLPLVFAFKENGNMVV